MLINGIRLSTLGAQLQDRVFTSNQVDTSEDWNEGSLEPTFIRQQDTFKDIALDFLIAETNEEDAFIVMSNLTMLLRKAIIVFDDMPNLQFDVTIDGQGTQKRLSNGKFLYSVKLKSDYAKGQSEVHTTNTTATDSFKLNIVYYKDSTTLIANEEVVIKASSFNESTSLADLGIEINKYQEAYYNNGYVTNFTGQTISYNNLYSLGTMIINYSPIIYTRPVGYYLNDGQGAYRLVEETTVNFTYFDYQNMTTMGQLINLNRNRPSGYKASVTPPEKLSFNDLMALNGTINVYFDAIENERTKEITVNYYKEVNDDQNDLIVSQSIVIRESDIVDGTTIGDIININGQKPNNYYENGYCAEGDINSLVTFDTLNDTYNIYYDRVEAVVYVEYYYGEYPGWYRKATDTYKIKYTESLEESENIIADVGISLNKYKNDYYNDGAVFNANIFTDFNSIASLGVVQIYYTPKEYTITVKYYQDNDDGTERVELGTKTYILTDPMFVSDPKLSDIINVNQFRPDSFAFSADDSYKSEISISALTQASPISIVYKPVAVVNTKSIVVKYKKQLSSTFSVINTSVITIEEAEVGGGVKLKDLFDVNAYKPEYYNAGVIDGYSAEASFTFEELQGIYEIYYFATEYSTQVRYYTDEVAAENWIGSNSISYTVLSFEVDTTAISLGLDINAYKPSYCSDGEIQYYGATTFSNLINLASIDVVYTSIEEPGEDDDINYPHRILFLQHNDMGQYDTSFPTWTLNHAYINTGVTCLDMSKLTVAMSTVRVFEDQPLYNVNVGDRYLFGATSANGSYYIKYQNNTTYTSNPTGHNYFIAAAGNGTPLLQIEEAANNGFSRNTGIYASERAGYSYATLTYSNLIQSNSAQMLIPLYLFACNNNGNYMGGIAGVGITGCKIYYDGVLLRDFVPVQYYDLIGTKVAPSNCLYDKVTQTFFEDATKKNSFNIMDDDMYEDTDPVHNIGKCYVNYYKGGNFFQTRIIYFRESDFLNGNVWDPQEKLGIENYQPEFYGEGVITNIDQLGGITFNNLKDFVFEVDYPATAYQITINYYKDNDDAANLIATEKVDLVENMFYSVPTFGMIVDLLKYKPDGYGLRQDDIPYKDDKITIRRLTKDPVYNIIYTQWDNPVTKTITVKYYKHKNWIEPKNPIRQYDFLGDAQITIDETEVIDGIYPEQFINFNLYKPANEPNYWYSGAPFEWYKEDENLLGLDNLRDEYIVTYEPRTQYININYYTDEVDEANLIATDSWGIKINDWDFNAIFTIADELPNAYINRYKPITCDGGILQDSDRNYTFDSLVQQGHLDVVYISRIEPHDPDDDSFPNKVLWYYPDKGIQIHTDGLNSTKGYERDWRKHNGGGFVSPGYGPYIPYLNLGYTPKEIERLRVQTKFYSLGGSMYISGTSYAPGTLDYMGILGYAGPMDRQKLRKYIGEDDAVKRIFGSGVGQDYNLYSKNSPESSGYFSIKGHCPYGSFGGSSRRTSNNFWGGVVGVDNNKGMSWSNTQQTQSIDEEIYHSCYKGATAGFRLGNYVGYNEDLEPYKENDDHTYTVSIGDHKGHKAKSFSNAFSEVWRSDKIRFRMPGEGGVLEGDMDADENSTGERSVQNLTDSSDLNAPWAEMNPSTFFHPYTVTLDAYNKYCEIYDMSNSENPEHWDIDTSKDLNLYTDRCKPKGPITLFTTTNPDTGEVNIAPALYKIRPRMVNYNDIIAGYSSSPSGQGNDEETGNQEAGSSGSQGQTASGDGSQIEIYGGLLNMEYNSYKVDVNCPWGDGRADAFPVPMRTAVWGVKIWDRDRLVRDLIPVAKGDEVYDYIMPANGMFDKVTEIFFGNVNEGKDYGTVSMGEDSSQAIKVSADEVYTLRTNDDPTIYGKIIVNYYDYDDSFIGNQYVEIPCDYFADNISFKDVLKYNDMKPSDYYHDGLIDTDVDIEDDVPNRVHLKDIYDQGAINVYYKQKQYTKTVVYYYENSRVGSKDFFFSQAEIEAANTLEDLGVDAQLYASDEFKPGVIMSDETIIASDDVAAFINAPSPVVVYHKYTKEERPDLFYYEYYRGGAYEPEDQQEIVLNSDNKNYLDCDLTAVCLNPEGAIKYLDHYHDALYEDEKQTYFISYQVDINVNYCEVHKGPARGYNLLAEITDRDRYTIVEENRGWGRLKEYPKGWILLANTKPIVGPGQNPDYDKGGNLPRVTVPFGTRFSITKMTIDRLWAYAPEFGSWIKTEEISFDQSGRLYNALSTGVIHLDKIDWSEIESLDDLKIYPEKFKLRFHENCDYTYDGEFTQEAFSDLHSVDFVYPEIIYPYAVKYYKDTLDESNLVGSGGFSCSLSDWNPDWDTFISTSWKTGYPAKIIAKDTFHRTVGMTKDYDVKTTGDKVYVLDGTRSIDGVSCSYCIWKGYIGYYPTAALDIDRTLRETINPTLYRSGEPIYLTWDFYNLDANLYKPNSSYNDGIFLWNPRTYDNDNIKFSFEELITTGKQTILYTPVMDVGYKAKFTNGFLRLPMDITNFYYVPTSAEPGIWDIEIKYQPSYEPGVTQSGSDHDWTVISGRQTVSMTEKVKPNIHRQYAELSYDGLATGHPRTYDNETGRDIDILDWGEYREGPTSINPVYYIYYDSSYIDGSTKGEYYNIVNFSNKRDAEKAICQITGNDLSNWQNKTPTFKARGTNRVNVSNNSGYSHMGETSFSADRMNIGHGCYYQTGANNNDNYFNKAVGNNIVYYVKVWKNYYLEHYYVPLPHGYWLPTGEQLTQNTFYDLITKTIATKAELEYPYSIYSAGSAGGSVLSTTPVPNNLPDIYKLHASTSGNAYDYFKEWTYDTEDCNLIVRTNNKINGYKHPDALSDVLTTIDKYTVIPIKKLTADAAHHVQGTWYWTGKYWIKATQAPIYSYNDYSVDDYNKTVALKGDTSNTAVNYYGYRRPDNYQPEYFELEYANASNQYARLDTGIKAYQVGKIEVEFDYIDAPQHDNYGGYIIGSGKGYPSLRVDWSTDKVSGGETLIKGNHYKIVAVRETHNADSYNSTNPHEVLMISVNGGTPAHFGITPGSYSNTYDSPVIINGAPTNGYSVSNERYGIKAKYYSVKIWDTTGTLIYDLSFRAKQNGDTITNYGYNNLNQQYIEMGNYWTYPTVDWINPQSTSSIFTTEQLDSIFFKSNDFYWNGRLWIPASYTDDYIITFDEPKTYIVATDTLYNYRYPIENDTYKHDNLLSGDRVKVIGVLGKDNNWYKTNRGYWVFNNNTLNELEV